jgi:glycerate 2-kinase
LPSTIQDDAQQIWKAGVAAVRADRVVMDQVQWDGRWLTITQDAYDLSAVERLWIVGAGKATSGLLRGLLHVFLESPYASPATQGWINIPEGAFQPEDLEIARIAGITVCQARPPGMNEPTERVVHGTGEIVRIVENAGVRDCVITLISGGGSALLCLPSPGISLDTKLAVTRSLSARGANIEQLNAVRRCMSQVKGGGLARRCHAPRMLSLILSDVLGDPLEYIASGPTVLNPRPDPRLASNILKEFCPGEFLELLSRWESDLRNSVSQYGLPSPESECVIRNHVMANNATAVMAAKRKAGELGYRLFDDERAMAESTFGSEAAAYGTNFARSLLQIPRSNHDTEQPVDNEQPVAWITGGEPTVVLPASAVRGRGGRNQHLVLAAGIAAIDRLHAPDESTDGSGDGNDGDGNDGDWVILSGGTDGEDGPTDAAGAWVDRDWVRRYGKERDVLEKGLARCDSYSIFERTGNLLRTGPTHTNVCDVRVGLRRGAP